MYPFLKILYPICGKIVEIYNVYGMNGAPGFVQWLLIAEILNLRLKTGQCLPSIKDNSIQEFRTDMDSATWRRLECSETEWRQCVERSQNAEQREMILVIFGAMIPIVPGGSTAFLPLSLFGCSTLFFIFPWVKTFLFFAYARSNRIFLRLATNAAVNLISLISTSLNFKSKLGENTLALISTWSSMIFTQREMSLFLSIPTQ